MNLLLETTIQINKFLADKDERNKIRDVLINNKLYSTTYVFGEYMSNIVKETVTMYNILKHEDDLDEAFLKAS